MNFGINVIVAFFASIFVGGSILYILAMFIPFFMGLYGVGLVFANYGILLGLCGVAVFLFTPGRLGFYGFFAYAVYMLAKSHGML